VPDGSSALVRDAASDAAADAATTWPPGPSGCRVSASGASQPFGAHEAPYFESARLPSHVYRSERDALVRNTYDRWKARYLVDASALATSPCDPSFVYAKVSDTPNLLTNSGSHGQAMLIVAIMAGYDPDGRRLFDGMVRFFLAHPSLEEPHLMARQQRADCADKYTSSASDGDLDIAYALLLADKQWGSGGDIDYGTRARQVIAAIRRRDVDPTGSYMLLGSGVAVTEEHRDGTRTSDFMPGHFTSFAEASGDDSWRTLSDRAYGMVDDLQQTYASTTGLLPAFAKGMSKGAPRPVDGRFFGDEFDGAYSENACRAPLRIALDYLTSGNGKARTAVGRMNEWMTMSTAGDPLKIRAGYRLDGTPLSESTSMAFVAPLGVAAMVGTSHDWLNALWDALSDETREDKLYLGDTLQLLSLIAMSGNWWTPEAVPCPLPPEPADAGMATDAGADAGDGGPDRPVPFECVRGEWGGFDEVAPLKTPQCAIEPEDVPMFVSVGFTTRGDLDGLTWALALAQKHFFSFTFFVSCESTFSPEFVALLQRAVSENHEIGNGGFDVPLFPPLDQSAWQDNIERCGTLLMEKAGLTMPPLGFRTPEYRYTDATLAAVDELYLMYDSSIVEGFQGLEDGTDHYWPYTLDTLSPGHTEFVMPGTDIQELTPHPGLWELPLYALLPPPHLRRKFQKVQPWFTIKMLGIDENMWQSPTNNGFAMDASEVLATLSYSFDRRVQGNKAPFVFAASTALYDSASGTIANSTLAERRDTLEAFLDYVRIQPTVRVATHADVIRWARAPAGR
jgi:endo-1,4-beta-D-glucanase Y